MDRSLGAEKFRVLLEAHKVISEKSEIRPRQISENMPDLASGTYERFSELKPVHNGFDFSSDLFAVVGV